MVEQNATKGLQIIKRTDDDSFVYMIVDDTYAVFKLSTFAPVPPNDDNLTSPQFMNFLKVVKYFLAATISWYIVTNPIV